MFIKSKYEQNLVINKYALFSIPVKTNETTIIFQCFNYPLIYWGYKSEKEMDQEYVWVIKQLDLKENQ